MLAFVESVKQSVTKRAEWERHRLLPVKKLIPADRHAEMQDFLSNYLTMYARCKVESVEGVGTVLRLSTYEPKQIARTLCKKAQDLGVFNVFHTEVREKQQIVLACLEDLG